MDRHNLHKYFHLQTTLYNDSHTQFCLAMVWSGPFKFHPGARGVSARQSFPGAAASLWGASREQGTSGAVTRLPPGPPLQPAVLTCTLPPQGARGGLF